MVASGYTVNPALKRCFMLMAAKHQYGLTGRCDWKEEPTYLHHKTEIIRQLMEQINRNPSSPSSWSFTTIFFLVAMEVSRNPSALIFTCVSS